MKQLASVLKGLEADVESLLVGSSGVQWSGRVVFALDLRFFSAGNTGGRYDCYGSQPKATEVCAVRIRA